MAKESKKTIERTYRDNLHIEWEDRLDKDYVITRYLILCPTKPISIIGDSTDFEWQGTFRNESVKITLQRQTSERAAVIPENFPNEMHPDRGSTRDQLYSEIKRVLRQLN